ncbi:hypothetical protein EIP91_009949, partial [Steccherinum ochraceum]
MAQNQAEGVHGYQNDHHFARDRNNGPGGGGLDDTWNDSGPGGPNAQGGGRRHRFAQAFGPHFGNFT